MGLFNKLKDQALNSISGLAGIQKEEVSNEQYLQAPMVPSPTPQAPVVQSPVPQAIEEKDDNGIYGNYIEHLIEMALADGELTEKEKQVLFKKAEANGIDLDEFEMVLDARLFERQKTMQTSSPAAHGSAPKSDKYGDVRKCPSCGAIVESFVIRCPDCGYEFRNIGATSSFSLLSAKLEALDSRKVAEGGLADIFQGDVNGNIDDKKADLIKGFPIPTTKEDILEFVTMATPLAMPAAKSSFFSPADDISKAWRSKCEQVIMKARFSMKEDKALLEQIEQYATKLKLKA